MPLYKVIDLPCLQANNPGGSQTDGATLLVLESLPEGYKRWVSLPPFFKKEPICIVANDFKSTLIYFSQLRGKIQLSAAAVNGKNCFIASMIHIVLQIWREKASMKSRREKNKTIISDCE